MLSDKDNTRISVFNEDNHILLTRKKKKKQGKSGCRPRQGTVWTELNGETVKRTYSQILSKILIVSKEMQTRNFLMQIISVTVCKLSRSLVQEYKNPATELT